MYALLRGKLQNRDILKRLQQKHNQQYTHKRHTHYVDKIIYKESTYIYR